MREERFQQLEEIEFVWDAKKLAARAKPSAAEISSDEEAEGEEPDAAGPMPPRLLGASQADRSNKRAVKKRHAAEEEEDRSLPDDAEEEDSDEEPSSYGIATRAKKRAANGTCVKPSKVVAAETQPEREEHKEDEEVATDNVAPPFENHIAPELFVSEPNLVKPKGPSYIQLQEEKLHHYNERQSSRKKRRRRNERNDSGHEGEDREEEASQIQLLRELVAAQRELIEEKSNSAALQKKVTQLQERENRRLQKKLGRQKMAESDDDEEEEASDSKEDSDGDDESTSRPNAKKHPKSLKKLIFALEQSRKNKRSTIKLEEDTFHD
ncbi:expressed unknown protein [Seminavis robusta]|uniref:Uncharacterized protein n=1 Tax=Seminavis robusta TaxID=568900 RepID=A0A9N8HP16_9STRA|nr:expressed unknown protein [Seminavis robusta]|eukprot:Sro1277_g258700.1 n/a (324) ;mRNA; f:20525-21496